MQTFRELNVRTEITYKITLSSLPPQSVTKLLKKAEKQDQARRDLRVAKKRFKEEQERKKEQLDDMIMALSKERAAFEREKSKAQNKKD